jgi:hypothetical protein
MRVRVGSTVGNLTSRLTVDEHNRPGGIPVHPFRMRETDVAAKVETSL